jgi:hypothetical protein
MPFDRKTLGPAAAAVLTAALAATYVVTQDASSTRTPIDVMAGAVHEATEVPGRLASLASNEKASPAGKHLGFDTYAYPGDEVMRAWRHKDVPYEWVGYYLPAPCHKGRTWVGKRERLVEMGWGMAVVYVGQQTWEKTPSAFETRYVSRPGTKLVSKRVKQTVRRNGKRVTRYVTRKVPVKAMVQVPVRVAVNPTAQPLDQCDANLVSGARGRMEADDAIARTAAEGFPKGSVIFLDLERMDRVPQAMRDYYKAWTKRVLEDGRYRPGYYAHKYNADRVYVDVKAEFIAVGMTDEPPFWLAGGKDFSPDKAPHQVGRAYAGVWQGVLDVVQEWQGYKLPLDVNVAQVPDPSHQYVATD